MSSSLAPARPIRADHALRMPTLSHPGKRPPPRCHVDPRMITPADGLDRASPSGGTVVASIPTIGERAHRPGSGGFAEKMSVVSAPTSWSRATTRPPATCMHGSRWLLACAFGDSGPCRASMSAIRSSMVIGRPPGQRSSRPASRRPIAGSRRGELAEVWSQTANQRDKAGRGMMGDQLDTAAAASPST